MFGTHRPLTTSLSMRDAGFFLCARRVCSALRIKYGKDPRHAMDGLQWQNGEWTQPRPLTGFLIDEAKEAKEAKEATESRRPVQKGSGKEPATPHFPVR